MKTSALLLGILLTPPLGLSSLGAQDLEIGDRFHVDGCENGELVIPVVHLWSQPTIAMGGRPIATLSGQGRADGVGRCQGAVVAALDVRTIAGRTHIKVESVVNGTIGWITDSFVGKKFDTDQCREHFTELEHIRRCEAQIQTKTSTVTPPPTPTRNCCRICRRGKACGNSCIARNLTCRQPPGCACNGGETQGDSVQVRCNQRAIGYI